MMLSVSSLSSFLYCERKLYLEKVFGLREPYKAALIKGTIRHKAHEEMVRSEEALVNSLSLSMSLVEIQKLYGDKCRVVLGAAVRDNESRLAQFNLDPSMLIAKTLPLVVQEFNERAETVFSFMTHHQLEGARLWKELIPKIEVELRISSDEMGFRGIVDHIEVYKDGYVPIELKTGKAPMQGVWPGHKIQLVAYALLLEEKFKTTVKEGFVKYLDTQDKRHISLNPFMREEIKELVEKVRELLKSPEVPDFVSNKNKCTTCGLRDTCYNGEKMSILQSQVGKSTTPE